MVKQQIKKINQKQLVSVSRRTDMIAFWYDWLKEQIKQGYVNVPSPYGKQVYTRSLKPKDVKGFVFWSKNYANFIKDNSFLDPYCSPNKVKPFYFHFTINSDEKFLERNHSNTLDERIKQAITLSEMFSPDAVMWRFDPIVHWKDGLEIKNNLKDFEHIAGNLVDAGINNCTFSFVTVYRKVINRARKFGVDLIDINESVRRDIVKWMREVAPRSLKLHTCCNTVYKEFKVLPARCIDGDRLGRLWRLNVSKAKASGQRDNCNCSKSIDIGNYKQECSHSCVYCYARPATDNINIPLGVI